MHSRDRRARACFQKRMHHRTSGAYCFESHLCALLDRRPLASNLPRPVVVGIDIRRCAAEDAALLQHHSLTLLHRGVAAADRLEACASGFEEHELPVRELLGESFDVSELRAPTLRPFLSEGAVLLRERDRSEEPSSDRLRCSA